MKTIQLITDSQSLVSAKSRFGHNIPIYDDGYGPLFIHRTSMGISGIVRAQTWEDAYSICEDEFFPEASETIEEIRLDYNFTRKHVKIIQTADGVEREDEPEDYPFEKTGCSFVRWDTIETPAPEGEDVWPENELFQEAFGFRPNGVRSCNADGSSRDPIGHGIYAKDLNGDTLETLTPELLAALEITLEITGNE